MYWLSIFIFASGIFPLLRAGHALRRSSMAHALAWAVIAWLSWGLLLLAATSTPTGVLAAGRYAGLCLIGSAGVAVLGARRPGVGAWNFVVVGLLAVFALSWAEGFLTQATVRLGAVRAVFLAGTLAVGIVNYLPTRLSVAAALLGVACGHELWGLLQPPLDDESARMSLEATGIALGLAPWLAWIAVRSRPQPSHGFDRLWLEFRDRYGFLWAARLREQFNRSAANTDLPVELRWFGLRSVGGHDVSAQHESAAFATLQALMKRFGVE